MLILLFSNILLPSFAPKPDIIYLIDDGTDFFLLPVVLYLCSVGIVFLMGIGLAVSLVALESTVHKSALKLLARSVSFNVSWSDYLMTGLQKVPLIVVVTLILLRMSTCGSLALCLGCLFYFLRLTQMSQDYVEEVVWHFAKNTARKIKNKLFRKQSNTCNDSTKSSLCITEGSTDDLKQENDETPAIKQSVEQSETEEIINESDPDAEQNTPEQAEEQLSEEEKGNRNESDDDQRDSKAKCSKTNDKDHIAHHRENNVSGKDKCSDMDKQVILKNEKGRQVAVIDTIDKGNEVKDSDKEKRKEILAGYSAIFFHSTIFLLWFIVTVINLPAVMTWARNFQFSKTLMPDDSFIPGIVLSACAFPLWQFELPNSNRKWLDKLQLFILGVAIISLLFATISIYRLNYLLTVTIAVITLQQLLAPKIEASDEDENEEDTSRTKYENHKSKLE
nr:unnamed protein product [Callosobruchus analis]